MKKLVVLSALLAAAGLCSAQEVGRVISSTPVMQQVAIPHQVCGTGQVVTQAPVTGAGAVIGAIAGGVVGNAIGAGAGRAAATAIGALGGAVVGNSIEASGQTQVQNVPQCGTQFTYESQPVGYNVVYEYAGKQYSVQMANNPGPTVPLQISPVGTQAPTAGNYGAAPMDGSQVVVAPTYYPAPVAYPVYPAYYPPYPYYSPVGVSLNFGFGGYYGGHYGGHYGGRRWR
ncbi:MAG: glycine zipper 2TM domain-containing protein [Rhodoferax sp.]